MTPTDTLDRIRDLKLLAVIRGPSQDLTLKIVDALVRGGIRGIEVTFSTPGALDVVAGLNDRYGDQIVLGMGTLTGPEQAESARTAGARFLVSPHTDDALAGAMKATGLACMFGALTPSEVMRAYALGADIVKIFPGSVGGPKYLKALMGPLPHIPMMPTGGVNAENLAEWLAAGAVAVGAGSALCPRDLAEAGRFDEITDRARQYSRALTAAAGG